MADNAYQYIWRCAKCTCHFTSILKFEGSLRQEKKCPKCKCQNILTLSSKEIVIQCRQPEEDSGAPDGDNYGYPSLTE